MTSYPISSSFADHVLVASPSNVVRQWVLESLRSPCCHFEQASGGAEALVHLESGGWQILFLDRRLPDLDAEELSQTVRQRFPGIEVVMIDPDLPSESKPELHSEINSELNSQSHATLAAEEQRTGLGREMRPAVGDMPDDEFPRGTPAILGIPLPGMIGSSRVMQPVYRLARLLALRNTAVLITGPTGSGKEIVARALSPSSTAPRFPKPCSRRNSLDMRAAPLQRPCNPTREESRRRREGTLFLDEIGEMPLSLQPKLLRFLEQKELQRLGSAEVVRVDTRVISATNAHLPTLVRGGKFRETCITVFADPRLKSRRCATARNTFRSRPCTFSKDLRCAPLCRICLCRQFSC